MRKNILQLAALIACAVSCNHAALENDCGSGVATMSLTLYDPDFPQGKSALVKDDRSYSNATLLVYDEVAPDGKGGNLVYEFKDLTPGATVSGIELHKKERYNFYAVCNYEPGAFTAPGTVAQLEAMTLPASFFDHRIMRSGWVTDVEAVDGQSVTLQVMPVAARLMLKMDKSAVAGEVASFNVRSVLVRQSPQHFCPFGYGHSAEQVKDGDFLSADDLQNLNSGVPGIALYIPENMQGTVGVITASKDKVPANLPSPMRERASYVEILADVILKSGDAGTITYRFYPGANAVDDFNLERGMQYNVTFAPSANIYNTDSWKLSSPFINAYIDPDDSGGGSSDDIIIEH